MSNLIAAKKLKGKPKIRSSTLNQKDQGEKKVSKNRTAVQLRLLVRSGESKNTAVRFLPTSCYGCDERKKRAGSEKRSKKLNFVVNEERVIEPEWLPAGSTFNGYREYDVQDLVIERHNIRFLLAEYITPEGKTVVGKIPSEYQGHYGPTLLSFVLYQHAPLSSAAELNC